MYNKEEWPLRKKKKKRDSPYEAETMSIKMIISVGSPATMFTASSVPRLSHFFGACTLFPHEGTQEEQLHVQ